MVKKVGTVTYYRPEPCPYCRCGFSPCEGKYEAEDEYQTHLLQCSHNPDNKRCDSCSHKVKISHKCQLLVDNGFDVFIGVDRRNKCSNWKYKLGE